MTDICQVPPETNWSNSLEAIITFYSLIKEADCFFMAILSWNTEKETSEIKKMEENVF